MGFLDGFLNKMNFSTTDEYDGDYDDMDMTEENEEEEEETAASAAEEKTMKNGFLKVAVTTPDLRVADCEYNKNQMVEKVKKMEC